MGILSWFLGKTDKVEDNSDTEEINDIILFDIDEPIRSEIAQCTLGDHVKLWETDQLPGKVFIYRSGTVGGQGKLGFVPAKYINVISSHLLKKLPVETEIINITPQSCKIRCRLVTQEEHAVQIQKQSQKLHAELTNKYTPRSGFDVSLELPIDHKLKNGAILYLSPKPINFYTDNPETIRLEFVDVNQTVVAYKQYEMALIKRILRAYFSNYNVILTIQTIENLDRNSFPCIKYVKAKAKVAFIKDAVS